eukprot:m.10206 g.10206  ORF g.10206 m.10206 type:complete len:94 (+) comp8181_c0_seq1:1815-2096(+)
MAVLSSTPTSPTQSKQPENAVFDSVFRCSTRSCSPSHLFLPTPLNTTHHSTLSDRKQLHVPDKHSHVILDKEQTKTFDLCSTQRTISGNPFIN